MKADYVHKDTRTLEEKPQVFIRWIDPTIEELKQENKELKEKYENAVADYETTMAEKEQLNSLVNSCQEEIRQLKKQVEEYENEPLTNKISRIDCVLSKIYSQNKTQQKEFINYLEKTIIDSKVGSGQQYYYQQVLEMYKEITGDDK